MTSDKRTPRNRRSWLFLPGAEKDILLRATHGGADVLIQELEDFVPPERKSEARALVPEILAGWHAAGVVATVRINPLESGGFDDLVAAMPGCPDAVLMAMVTSPAQIRKLDETVSRHEALLGIAPGSTEIVPNIETAAGLVQAGAIAAASPRVTAMLVAAEDMVADLDAERTPGCDELAYVRQRFLVECVAAGVVAIDCPYTFTGLIEAEADMRFARSLGYKAKSLVHGAQIDLVNRLLTPSPEEIVLAQRRVTAFEAARAAGLDRVDVDGLMVEVPTYRAAKRLLTRAAELGAI
ncbi:MAG: CoA ester lyase [Rhizobiales bacterium PAR1]|nr:MAG: CoA ester lyase [Rhizobiales bacterium PAR1]